MSQVHMHFFLRFHGGAVVKFANLGILLGYGYLASVEGVNL